MRSRPGPAWLVCLFLVGVALLAAYFVLRQDDASGHKPVLLRHAVVERFIEANLGASGVVCNRGYDFPMRHDGDTFTCTSRSGRTFTVRITDTSAGLYTIT